MEEKKKKNVGRRSDEEGQSTGCKPLADSTKQRKVLSLA